MKAHVLVERLIKAGLNAEAILIAESTKFDLGELKELDSMVQVSTGEVQIELPAPSVLFGVNVIGQEIFVFARQIEDRTEWRCYTENGRAPFKVVMPKDISFATATDKDLEIVNDDATVSDGFTTIAWRRDSDGQAVRMIFAVHEAIEVFSCTNVVAVDNPAPKFINQKRIAKGKPPVFSYKTLHITGERPERTESIGGKHASPRLHLRRGHIRRLANGNRIWVRSCLVGDKSKGFIKHDYIIGETVL